ncbi:MAG: hypothetical protein GY715_09850 [Planctomycetes bacterium]|nr:hypothetical protein [Planctomycetota bacterium]
MSDRPRPDVIAALCATALLAAVLAAPAARAESEEACLHGKLHLAEASKAFDELTGRDKRNFPPDRLVDYLHLKLEMRFPDLESMHFTAVETLRIVPIGTPTRSLVLDAIGLDVSSARINGQAVEFFVDDTTVTVRFEPPLELGREYELVFEYACERPYAGMIFTPAAADVDGYGSEVHTQGQTVTNRHWFISHDAPNERMTSELIVDVPDGYAVSGNGRLVSQFTNDDRAVWHWLQDKPHVSYLVSLVIGDFDRVELEHARVPMTVWAPKGLGGRVEQSYGRTGAMIDLFERRFGVEYPWARYDQLVVKNFGAGGMENTSATTMYPSAVFDANALLDGDLDSLIAHELAHQWTGDLITCKEWAHIWLNEGFATFGSALWFEQRDGEDGYLASIRRSMGVARRDRTTGSTPMVSGVYERAWETFRRPGNPYPKGSSILHMLRRMLGEQVFWEGVRLYMNRHALGTVETNDFRYALEEVSGRGLEWFFEQWCFRPGCPNLDVTIDYDGGTRELLVDVAQTQKTDERTPAFRFELPVFVRTAHGDRTYTIDVTETTTSFRTTLDGVPEIVAVDPWLHVLCTMNVEKADRLWERQANDGPTLPARHRAVDALGESDTPDHRALLTGVIRDDTLHHSIRSAAVEALRGFGSDEAKAEAIALLDEPVAEAKVRVKLVAALGDHDAADVTERLAGIASTDVSYDTRVAAINALAKLEAKDHADTIAELVHFPSQHDDVRVAALDALAEFDDARGLDLALQYSAYGHMDRARARTISVIGKLAEHDRDRAVEALLVYLDDPCRRPAKAAGEALAKIGDERAIQPLKAMAETHPSPDHRERAEKWLEKVRKKVKEAEEAEKVASG